MTVQELIEALMKIKDKNKEVNVAAYFSDNIKEVVEDTRQVVIR